MTILYILTTVAGMTIIFGLFLRWLKKITKNAYTKKQVKIEKPCVKVDMCE